MFRSSDLIKLESIIFRFFFFQQNIHKIMLSVFIEKIAKCRVNYVERIIMIF